MVSADFPVVVSKFIEDALEIDFDGVAHDGMGTWLHWSIKFFFVSSTHTLHHCCARVTGKVIAHAISQHVENAGM